MDTTKPVTDPQLPPRPTDRGQWALPLVLAIAIAVSTLLLVVVREKSSKTPNIQSAAPSGDAWTPPAPPQTETVSLAVDFGNGSRRSFDLPWSAGMTVGELLRLASDVRPGVQFTQQGADKLAMLTSLDGVANGTAGGRFWLYEVNGEHAIVSFAVQPLAPGDRVLWVFKQPE